MPAVKELEMPMLLEYALELEEMEFEKELKRLDKNTFSEFRRQFREYTSALSDLSDKNDPDTLRILSRKLHLTKREHEKRELLEKAKEKVKQILSEPEQSLTIDVPDFKEIVHQMEGNDFKTYFGQFKQLYLTVLNDRKRIIQLNTKNAPFDKKNRENLKVLKRWDVLEEEMSDREKRLQ